jgi:hypothetical protein
MRYGKDRGHHGKNGESALETLVGALVCRKHIRFHKFHFVLELVVIVIKAATAMVMTAPHFATSHVQIIEIFRHIFIVILDVKTATTVTMSTLISRSST